MATVIQNDQFEAEVLKSGVPVLVDFFATWCGPCKMLAPTLEELSGEYEGKVKVVKVDVDQAQALAMSYGVRSVPTMVIFKDGNMADKMVGAMPKADIAARIDQAL